MASPAGSNQIRRTPFQNLRVKVGRAVGSSEQTEEIILNPKNQFALELDHMAECVKNNQLPYTPGERSAPD
jgi:hypothetical protein